MADGRSLDWYLVLGVSPTASSTQITHAYRAALRRHHPDTRRLADVTDPSQAAAADTALARVQAAYTIVGDPGRRAVYDQQRVTARAPEQPHTRITIDHRSARSTPVSPIRAGPVHWSP